MNFKLVLKAYSTLRQLTDDESALLNTLRAMNDNERELLVESLSPVKTGKKATRKPTAKKSARASSLAEQIKAANRPLDGGVSKMRCGVCGNYQDYEDHSEPSPHFHPFAPTATPQSPASNGASSGGAANSGTLTESAGTVVSDSVSPR